MKLMEITPEILSNECGVSIEKANRAFFVARENTLSDKWYGIYNHIDESQFENDELYQLAVKSACKMMLAYLEGFDEGEHQGETKGWQEGYEEGVKE